MTPLDSRDREMAHPAAILLFLEAEIAEILELSCAPHFNADQIMLPAVTNAAT